MIIDKISREIFSFLDINAIQEIFNELKTIRIAVTISKVWFIKSYFSPLNKRLATEVRIKNTTIK